MNGCVTDGIKRWRAAKEQEVRCSCRLGVVPGVSVSVVRVERVPRVKPLFLLVSQQSTIARTTKRSRRKQSMANDSHSHDPKHSAATTGHAAQDAHSHDDAWHSHDATEPPAQETHGTINFGMIFGVFLGIVAFVVVSVVALMVAFNHTNNIKQETITERSLAAEHRPKRERVEQDMMEDQYKVADAQRKLVQIPLAQAMDKVLVKYEKGSKQMPQPKGTLAPGVLYSPEAPAKP